MEMTKSEIERIVQKVNIILTEFSLGVVDLFSDGLSLEEWTQLNKNKTRDNLKLLENYIKEMCE
jgi:hypothetical protein